MRHLQMLHHLIRNSNEEHGNTDPVWTIGTIETPDLAFGLQTNLKISLDERLIGAL